MNAQMVLTMGQEALLMLLMVSAPVLGVVLLVGLVISLFQAVTQINEATLAFVPKLLAAVAVFAMAELLVHPLPLKSRTASGFVRTSGTKKWTQRPAPLQIR